MMIQAEYQAINDAANAMKGASEEYLYCVKELYNIVNDTKSVWEGTDNERFVDKVNDHKANIDALGKIISDYSQFLLNSSASVEGTQDEVTSAASRL